MSAGPGGERRALGRDATSFVRDREMVNECRRVCLSAFCIVLTFSLETALLFMIFSGSHGREYELREETV